MPRGERHPGLAAVDLTSFWREYQAAAPPILRVGFRTSVWALTLAPLAMGHGAPLHRLSAPEQDEVLTRLARSEHGLVRQLVLATKLVASFAYFTDDSVRRGWES